MDAAVRWEAPPRIAAYRSQLLGAGFQEAALWHSSPKLGLFYRPCTEQTAFVVDLLGTAHWVEVAYGFASTAFTRIKGNLSPGLAGHAARGVPALFGQHRGARSGKNSPHSAGGAGERSLSVERLQLSAGPLPRLLGGKEPLAGLRGSGGIKKTAPLPLEKPLPQDIVSHGGLTEKSAVLFVGMFVRKVKNPRFSASFRRFSPK